MFYSSSNRKSRLWVKTTVCFTCLRFCICNTTLNLCNLNLAMIDHNNSNSNLTELFVKVSLFTDIYVKLFCMESNENSKLASI